METVGTFLSLAIIVVVSYLFVHWYWIDDGRLDSDWFK